MKTLFFSDVHANLEALEAFIKQLKEESPDMTVFLGDMVGYGADPNQCIEMVREISDFIIAGNHDFAVCGRTPVEKFNDSAKEALFWTVDKISPENRFFLRKLPLRLNIEDFECAHSTPYEPENWDYLREADDAMFYIEFLKKKLCFIGHTHRPAVYVKTAESIETLKSTDIKIDTSMKYIINCGSVGQPRDGNPEGCFGIYDSIKGEFRLKRFSYPFEITQGKIIKAGLPAYFAKRLGAGS